MRLNIQLFGGRGASSGKTTKSIKASFNSQLAGEIIEMKTDGLDYATAVNYYKASYDIPLKQAIKDVKEYWSKKTGTIGNRKFFIYESIPKGFKKEDETNKYIIYVNKNNDRILKKKKR